MTRYEAGDYFKTLMKRADNKKSKEFESADIAVRAFNAWERIRYDVEDLYIDDIEFTSIHRDIYDGAYNDAVLAILDIIDRYLVEIGDASTSNQEKVV